MDSTQEHRRRCLIRQLLCWREGRGLEWLRAYVKGWAQWPGLADDFATQWQRGNRGEHGDWREA